VRRLSALLGIVDRAGLLPGRAKSDESPQSMRRKPSSTSTARIVQHDHRRSPDDGSSIQGELQHGLSGASRHPQVVDNFPTVVPVTQRELDVLEAYLGSLLDELLKQKQ
jgi:hypothetical protein